MQVDLVKWTVFDSFCFPTFFVNLPTVGRTFAGFGCCSFRFVPIPVWMTTYNTGRSHSRHFPKSHLEFNMIIGTTLSTKFHCPWHAKLIVCLLSSLLLTNLANAQTTLDRIGYTALQQEYGASLPDGSNATVALVEALVGAVQGDPTSGTYLPSLTGQLAGKTINDISMSRVGTSGHSTTSARNLFGSQSSSPGVDNVDVYDASDWLNSQLGISTTDRIPDVSSHSYILLRQSDNPATPQNETFGNAEAANILRRLDYYIGQNDTSVFVGSSNGNSTNLPIGLVPSYNAIAVGRTDGNHGAGETAFYGLERTKVDIVAPEGTTSAATPRVASVGALLHDAAGSDANASANQTIKATLLAGATIESSFAADWDRTSTRPLDERYGAGQVNAFNSYKIQEGGETNGTLLSGGPAVDDFGWDFKDLADGASDRFYEFEVSAVEAADNELSIALAWNLSVTALDLFDSSFDPSDSLTNYDLRLFDSSNNLVDASLSTVDNVEHIRINDLAAGTYSLQVSGDANDSYGLAWRFVAVPEPGSMTLVLLASCIIGARRRRE